MYRAQEKEEWKAENERVSKSHDKREPRECESF